MLITPSLYMAGLGQTPDTKPADAKPVVRPSEGLSAKGFLGATAFGAAIGAAVGHGRAGGRAEAKDLAGPAAVGGLVGLGLATLLNFTAKGVGSFATGVAAPTTASVTG